MLKYNLLFIYRNFKRNKSSFFINLIGLSTGLAGILLIYLWVNDELHFDKFHQKGDRIFQVMEHQETEGSIKTTGQTTDFLARVLAEEMPEIETSAVVTPPNFFPAFTLSVPEKQVKGVGKFVDKDFLNIFSYPLLSGNSNTVLAGINDIIISESLAKNLFNTIDNCIGKSIEWQVMGSKRLVSVTGIMKDVPANSSERFDFLLTFDAFKDLLGIQGSEMNWNSTAPFLTYVLVKEKTDIRQLNTKVADLIKIKSKNDQHRTLFLKRYTDNYLYGDYKNGTEAGGRIEYVKLFLIIAIFILLIACINFMNLSTAKASKKIMEVGTKKVLGAQRKTLVWQFMGESMLMTFISFLIALVLVRLFLPGFSDIAGKRLELLFNLNFILISAAIAMLTAFLAGSYPALYLSRFNPIMLLKKQLNTLSGESWSRKGLVVFQFTISVIFIVSVLVVYKQTEFVQNKNLGYDKDNVLYFEIDGKITGNTAAFIAEAKNIAGVVNASSMLGGIIYAQERGGTPGKTVWNGKEITIENSAVNYDLLELLDLKIKEGRTFSRSFTSDKDKVIFNEAAIEALGLKDPIGKTVNGAEILGVVKNFHYQSFHELIKPIRFRLEPQSSTNILVKIRKGYEAQTISKLEQLYKSYNPGFVFDFKFLDQDYQAQYVAEKRVALLSRYFAGLAIIISCLGLFGLSIFTTELRTKEVGIRKVNGAKSREIFSLLSREYMLWVFISILIATPIAWYAMSKWLESFAYKTSLSWWIFALAGLLALGIALLTVSWQSWRAATRNPVEALRYE